MSPNILLVEPKFCNKYPPIGLMKIATSHKWQGDRVSFYRGTSAGLRAQDWESIYISTLFTFQWDETIRTIKFYKNTNTNLVVGGILATLMPQELQEESGIKPHVGKFKGNNETLIKTLKNNKDLWPLFDNIITDGVDYLPPDYSIFNNYYVPYANAVKENYILKATKGCFRNCSFCSVRELEPIIIDQVPLSPYVSYINKNYGIRRNLVLLDDNILASRKFNAIIDEIYSLGFAKGAKIGSKRRSVDFNQGLDIRLLTKEHLNKLMTIELRPLRVAFDDVKMESIFRKKMEMIINLGFRDITVYVLYNFNDSPEDFYYRLNISTYYNNKFGCRIYSFPMKYIPQNSKDRTYIGPQWSRRQIRGVQCILNAFHGIVPVKKKYFDIAFGKNVQEFMNIIQMPENYIIKRSENTDNGNINELWEQYNLLSKDEQSIVRQLLSGGKTEKINIPNNSKIEKLLSHYSNECNHAI